MKPLEKWAERLSARDPRKDHKFKGPWPRPVAKKLSLVDLQPHEYAPEPRPIIAMAGSIPAAIRRQLPRERKLSEWRQLPGDSSLHWFFIRKKRL